MPIFFRICPYHSVANPYSHDCRVFLSSYFYIGRAPFIHHPSQEDRRAAQKQASARFAEFLDEEYVSLGITFRTTWRDARDAIERKAPAETDVLEDNDRRRLVDELVSKLGKVRLLLLRRAPFRFHFDVVFANALALSRRLR